MDIIINDVYLSSLNTTTTTITLLLPIKIITLLLPIKIITIVKACILFYALKDAVH